METPNVAPGVQDKPIKATAAKQWIRKAFALTFSQSNSIDEELYAELVKRG